MLKFTSIEAFYQVVRYVKSINTNDECPDHLKIKTPVTFSGSVKLHGTNSGVTFDRKNHALICQSRSRVITSQNDNAGFASFVEKNEKRIFSMFEGICQENKIPMHKNVTVYGEWIGPGIQKGVGINDVKEKQWVIFSIKLSEEVDDKIVSEYVDMVPKLKESYKDINLFSIKDSKTWKITVDFNDDISKQKAITFFDKETETVENECPWAKLFGISGIGEGIVWIPTGEHWGKSDLYFKTKGDKHKVTKSKSKKEALSPEVLNSIEEFMTFSLTENRLNQGLDFLKEMNHEMEMKNMGHFIRWVCGDIQKECNLELEDNNLSWKQVSKIVSQKARTFFMEKIKGDI